jgi:transcription elongation factor GreA
MDNNNKGVKVAEAAASFIEGVEEDEREAYQQILNHFARWFGKERAFCEIMPSEIANYAERLSITDAEYNRKLEIVRVFLGYSKKKGFITTNLAVHLKSRKSKVKVNGNCIKKDAPQMITLTQEAYDKAKIELEELKKQRPQAIEEVSKAAADKDFRENAPLDAARERLSHLEGQIMDLEQLLKQAEIIEENSKESSRAGIGDCITLYDSESKERFQYTLVSAREFDPSNGKISVASPLGKALVGKCVGYRVEIAVTAGKLCYKIEKIEHERKVKNK